MNYKEVFSLLAVILGLVSFVPYVRLIILNKTKPHMFSWIIWGLTTFIVFFAQVKEGGGVGTIPMAFSVVFCLVISWLAYTRHTDVSIHPLDWIFLIASLFSLPLWYFTSDPLWTVIILTVIDILGFGPTIRKAYHLPFEEDALFYFIYVVRNALSIVALENYSYSTVLFPFLTGIATLILVLIILVRRKRMAQHSNSNAVLFKE